MTEYVLQRTPTWMGNVFGGQFSRGSILLRHLRQRHTGRMAITAGVDELSFEKPIQVGQVCGLDGSVRRRSARRSRSWWRFVRGGGNDRSAVAMRERRS